VKDYWAADLPVNRGRFNFDSVRIDYYRDLTIWVEALKGGQYDLKTENVSKNWATAYDTPAVSAGQLVKERFDNHAPQPMQGTAFNLRRPLFQDRLVRQALAYAFDFEWTNRTLFYGAYTRTRSYFPNSDMEAKGLPTPEEMSLLAPLRGQIPDAVFTTEYQPPKSDGSGNIRGNLAIALKLLSQAGWTVKNNQMIDKSGTPFEFEILLPDPVFERAVLPFAENLKRLGITARVRTVDPAQYQHRMENFDFDMTTAMFFETLSPGDEMRSYWGSASAEITGSDNVIGIKSPAVDTLIDSVVKAPDTASLLTAAHALDRVLQWGFYVIPEWNRPINQAVYWNEFGHPEQSPPYLTSTVDIAFSNWWYDPAKAATLTMRPRAQ
jgi:microcin C transport system substrate-binding protein